ncbi:MAG: putative phosphoesterase [Deltaproteobacteria bacterium]|nr:putative phosphoesterase [Deltaproteobacteria bacterium]
MKPFLYVTDLHGHIGKYERTFTFAKETGAALVINGGDISPAGRRHEDHERFYREFLGPYFARYQDAGIRYMTLTGNDDLGTLDGLLDEICAKTPLVTHLSQRMAEVDGYTFIGMNRVTDFPFRLKDRARRDAAGSAFGNQFGHGVLSTPDGFQEIPDWPAYAETLPTIEEELNALPVPADPARAVYVLHGPPSGVGLDKVRGGAAVGSPATLAFLSRVQPLLSLHGHIHESPEVSGVWRTKVGRTVCLQPGQSSEELTVVLGRLDDMTFERKILPF